MTPNPFTNNYFAVPSFRVQRPFAKIVDDPRLPAFVKVGESQYRILGKYDVSVHVRKTTRTIGVGPKTTVDRTVVPLPVGLVFLRVAGPVGEQIMRCKIQLVEVAGVDDRHELSDMSLVDPEGDEWIGVKSAKLVETPNLPKDVDWARLFFFDDRDAASTLRAFEGAKRVTSEPAAYRRVTIAGPWGDLPTVGQGVGDLPSEPS